MGIAHGGGTEPILLTLRPIDHAALVDVVGIAASGDASELENAIGVLDAETVIVVSFVACDILEEACAAVIARFDRKRNGRLISIVTADSQPHDAIVAADASLQIAYSEADAFSRSEAIGAAAFRAFSNEA